MTERTTPVLSRAQAFKIADAAARFIADQFDIYHNGPNSARATPETVRAFIYSNLTERFTAAPAPTPLPPDMLATAAEMMFTGGSFVQALGTALLRADLDNRARIVAAFPELIERYFKIATEGKRRPCPFCGGKAGADGFCGECGLSHDGYDRDGNRREYV